MAAAVFTVRPPFDSGSAGDCILRTPSGTEFKAVKAILSMGSAVFHDMFDMPSGTSESKNMEHLPVIPVEEDPETLQALLQMLYPIDPPPINSLSLAQKLVTACDKYFVSFTKLQLYLQKILTKNESLTGDPLSCYVLSWRVGLEAETMTASRYIHSIDLSDNVVAKEIISRSGSMEALNTLWDLRLRQEKASDEILELAMIDRDMACQDHRLATGTAEKYSVRKEGLRRALKTPYPICEDVEKLLGFRAGIGEKNCSACDDRRENRVAQNRMEVVAALREYPQTIQGFSIQPNRAE